MIPGSNAFRFVVRLEAVIHFVQVPVPRLPSIDQQLFQGHALGMLGEAFRAKRRLARVNLGFL
jgi:hypothetical protein